jgi:hypothetical protein
MIKSFQTIKKRGNESGASQYHLLLAALLHSRLRNRSRWVASSMMLRG